MRKSLYGIIILYAVLTVISLTALILDGLDIGLWALIQQPSHIWRLIFTVFFLSLSIIILLLFLCLVIQELTQRQFNQSLKRILSNQSIVTDETEIGKNLQRLAQKMQWTTSQLQRTQNERITHTQAIVQQERQRIARDLHDTVSQELFAASMMLSGLATSQDQLSQEALGQQLETVRNVLDSAQNDLRIMLLHLRPTELQGRRLGEGLRLILQELRDKNALKVSYQEDVADLPKEIENNLFRIAQEFISNTLKHARARHLEVYLFQEEHQVELKMVDDGVGFDTTQAKRLSYGLKNIEDRVADMAGQVNYLSAPGKGTAMTVDIPLLTGEENGEDNRIISG